MRRNNNYDDIFGQIAYLNITSWYNRVYTSLIILPRHQWMINIKEEA
jgi:hypothetical protein